MEIEPQEHHTKTLYEASMRGCVATLSTLLLQDPLILNRISLTFFSETPLHIASLLGHVEFTRALLCHKPKLAAELNSEGHSPLHLASAEGYPEIVKALLTVNTNVCLVPDQHGRIPLHLAVMRGRVEVIQLLISVSPESIQIKLRGQETILHLCVKYNHLEALKLLMKSVSGDEEFLNSADNDGNNIWHLSVIMKQIETLKYLLSIPEVRVETDDLAKFFRNYPLDLKSMSIQDSIGETSKIRRPTDQSVTSSPPDNQALVQSDERQPARSSRSVEWKRYLDRKGKWLEEKRDNLIIVATVLASMTYQALVNPPSGIQNYTNGTKEDKFTPAPSPELASNTHPELYLLDLFLCSNSVSFSASMGTIFLLICGFPLKHRFFVVIFLLGMASTIYTTAFAYRCLIQFYEVKLLCKLTFIHYTSLLLAFYWVLMYPGVIVVVYVLRTIRFSYRMVKKLWQLIFKVPTGPINPPLATTV